MIKNEILIWVKLETPKENKNIGTQSWLITNNNIF